MVFFMAYFGLPLLWLFVTASKPAWEIESGPFTLGSQFLLFRNISWLFTAPESPYGHWMMNSIIYSTTTSVVATLLCGLAGYSLAMFNFKGAKSIQLMVLTLAMVPANTVVFPLFLLFSKIGITNTAWAVILPGFAFPLGTFVTMYYLKIHLSNELLEAARLDRASELKIFWKLGLPAARPALAIVFLFTFIQSWNAYLLPLVMLSETHLYTIQLGLGTSYGGPGLVTATFVSMLPVLAVFLFLQRQIDANLPKRSERKKKSSFLETYLPKGISYPVMNDATIKPNLRVPGADGFRAIACLLVMFHHAAQRFNPDQSASWIKALHYAGWRSEVGVALFFVLSGCLLSMPFWNAYVNGHQGPSILAYARNRIARIVPGVWLSLIVSTLVAVKLLGGEFQPNRFFSGLFFVYSFYYKTFFPVDTNGPLWTVGLEAWCYICLPIILWAIFKFKRSIKNAFIGIFLWIIFLQALQPLIIKKFMTEDYEKGWQFGMTGGAKLWMPYWNFATFFSMFLLGSVAALAINVVRAKGKDFKFYWDVISVFAVVAASYIVLKYEIPGTPDSFTKQPYLAPWYPALIALGLFAAAVGGRFHKLVDNRFFRHVARVSFGLYLWHWLLLIIVERKLGNDYWTNGANNIYAWLGMVVFTYAVTWAIAGFSFKYFETPILRWNRREIARRGL